MRCAILVLNMEKQLSNNPIQQPPINPVPVSKKTNHWLIAIIIFVLIFIVGGVYALALQSQRQVPQPIVSPPPISPTPIDETANWKIYRNEEFGFELKYPPGWKLEDDNHSVFPGFKIQSPQNSSLAFYPKGWDIGLGNAQNLKEGTGELVGRKVSFISYFTEANEERARFIRFLDVPKGWDEGNWIFLEYKIHGLRIECALEISSQHPECTLDDGTIFFGDVDDEEKELLNQILSTFKFTDEKEQVVCTLEAKLCPDGSYVSRHPPTCKFAKCP